MRNEWPEHDTSDSVQQPTFWSYCFMDKLELITIGFSFVTILSASCYAGYKWGMIHAFLQFLAYALIYGVFEGGMKLLGFFFPRFLLVPFRFAFWIFMFWIAFDAIDAQIHNDIFTFEYLFD